MQSDPSQLSMFGEKFCLSDYYPEENETIYRYMNFRKFIDLLYTRTLYFSRGDQFNDPYEGTETLWSRNIRRKVHDQASYKENCDLYDRNRMCAAISCWYVGDNESIEMWKEFASGPDGIAIQSKVSNLKAALARRGRHMCIGKVEYVSEHDHEITKLGCPFSPFLIKREKKFSQESELRIIWGEGKGKHNTSWSKIPKINTKGLKIQIDPEVLIEDIIVSPEAPSWFLKTVRETVSGPRMNLLTGRPSAFSLRTG